MGRKGERPPWQSSAGGTGSIWTGIAAAGCFLGHSRVRERLAMAVYVLIGHKQQNESTKVSACADHSLTCSWPFLQADWLRNVRLCLDECKSTMNRAP